MDETGRQEIRILIVDDDKDIADILAEYLKSANRTVKVCYDGLSAGATIERGSRNDPGRMAGHVGCNEGD